MYGDGPSPDPAGALQMKMFNVTNGGDSSVSIEKKKQNGLRWNHVGLGHDHRTDYEKFDHGDDQPDPSGPHRSVASSPIECCP